MKKKTLFIAGDPIRDIYVTTAGSLTKSYEERDGGAYNVHRNATAILGSEALSFFPHS